jgi:hypothetical protein
MNEVMRGSYVKDCEIGVKRWNLQIQRAGHDFRLALPSARFQRQIGAWTNVPTDPEGRLISSEDYAARLRHWLPSESDRAFVMRISPPHWARAAVARSRKALDHAPGLRARSRLALTVRLSRSRSRNNRSSDHRSRFVNCVTVLCGCDYIQSSGAAAWTPCIYPRSQPTRSPAPYLWAVLLARIYELLPLRCAQCASDYVCAS